MKERRHVFYSRYGRTPLESGTGIRLWYADDGTIVDRWGRSLERVRVAGKLADELAARSRALSQDVHAGVQARTLVLDQIAGSKFLDRFDYNAYLLEKLADRDDEIARALADAGDEDAAAHAEAPWVMQLEEEQKRHGGEQV
jgi:hypothetical protein